MINELTNEKYFIFIDETGFNEKMLPIHGWAPKGKIFKMKHGN